MGRNAKSVVRSIAVVFAFFVFLLLNGCAGSPLLMMFKSADQLKEVDAKFLCNDYSVRHSALVKTEINRRQLLTQHEWEMVEAGQVESGMSYWALLASKGIPTPGRWEVDPGSSSKKYPSPVRYVGETTIYTYPVNYGPTYIEVFIENDRVVRISGDLPGAAKYGLIKKKS